MKSRPRYRRETERGERENLINDAYTNSLLKVVALSRSFLVNMIY